MAKDYRTEDGHILSKEDLLVTLEWLISMGYDHEYIDNYDDSEDWKKLDTATI